MAEMSEDGTIVVDQVGCARCDGDGHPQIEFKQFEQPVVAGRYVFTHWALCPTTGEPILMTTSASE